MENEIAMPTDAQMTQERHTSAQIRHWITHNLGLSIPSHIHIHHIDHNRKNNNLSNLIGITPQEHRLAHAYYAPKTPKEFKAWLQKVRAYPPYQGQAHKTEVRAPSMLHPCRGCKQEFTIGTWRIWCREGNYHEPCWAERQKAIR